MTNEIHPTAIIGEDVEIGDGCVIGPYVVIESGARIGNENEIGAGGYIFGGTEIGHRNRLMRAASLGGEPQSLGYRGEPTRLFVGDDNWFGENVVVHRGTTATGKTVIGNHLFLMNGTHVGHDSVVGNHVVTAPDVMLGGQCQVMDRANIGGGTGVHQHTRVGQLAMVGGLTRVTQDVLPFTTIVEGALYGLNSIGIKRAEGYPKKLDTLETMYRRFCVKREPLPSFLAWLEELPADPFVEAWTEFLSVPNSRGYVRARRSRQRAAKEE